jgi:hypothetical protein
MDVQQSLEENLKENGRLRAALAMAHEDSDSAHELVLRLRHELRDAEERAHVAVVERDAAAAECESARKVSATVEADARGSARPSLPRRSCALSSRRSRARSRTLAPRR